jgi:ribosomal 50S subunit-associated protein YjgA (DUF615 family)
MTMMPITEVERVVTRVLREQFRDEFLSSDVTPEDDFDGEPVIRVLAHLKKRIDDIDQLYQSVGAIRDALITAGDSRFVFLDQDYPGSDQEYEEEEID